MSPAPRRAARTAPRPDPATAVVHAALAALPNLGPASAAMLVAAGVRSPAELRTLGSVEAFRRVRVARSGEASAVLLYALEGALTGQRWDRLPADERRRLRIAAGLDAG